MLLNSIALPDPPAAMAGLIVTSNPAPEIHARHTARRDVGTDVHKGRNVKSHAYPPYLWVFNARSLHTVVNIAFNLVNQSCILPGNVKVIHRHIDYHAFFKIIAQYIVQPVAGQWRLLHYLELAIFGNCLTYFGFNERQERQSVIACARAVELQRVVAAAVGRIGGDAIFVAARRPCQATAIHAQQGGVGVDRARGALVAWQHAIAGQPTTFGNEGTQPAFKFGNRVGRRLHRHSATIIPQGITNV